MQRLLLICNFLECTYYCVICLQWKVRRTVASSIHELAVIVGEDVATQDLVPIFSGLIKDLDEVRIGALKHLAYFLKVSLFMLVTFNYWWRHIWLLFVISQKIIKLNSRFMNLYL